MDKKQAINLITQVCEQFKGNLQEHMLLQQALKVISKEEIMTENKEEEIKD